MSSITSTRIGGSIIRASGLQDIGVTMSASTIHIP